MAKPKTDAEKRIAELRKLILRERNKAFQTRLEISILIEKVAFAEAEIAAHLLELDRLRAGRGE